MSRAVHRLALRPGFLPHVVQQKRQIYAHRRVTRQPEEDVEPSFFVHFTQGTKFLKEESGRFVDEWKEKIKLDKPKYYYGDIVPQYNFREKKDRDQFFAVADSDFKLGYSKAEFVGTRRSTGLFRGFLDTRVPRDGKTHHAGYVVLQGSYSYKSFFRKQYLNWLDWTHFVIRCRGDGRQYFIRLHAYETDDLNEHLVFSYPLYTRGGPYWQITTIPFSKFFVVYKGTIQDRQHRVDLSELTRVGISLSERNPGPFELEIDYIAVEMSRRDEDEEFAYETYETPNNYSNAFGMK